jgi:hypothetical protein
MEKNTEFVETLKLLNVGETLKRKSLTFDEVFNLKYPIEVKTDPSWLLFYHKFQLFAITNKEFEMNVWDSTTRTNGKHLCPKDTKVRIWMVSRFGDFGITDNLKDPNGYHCRGVLDTELYDWEIVKITE